MTSLKPISPPTLRQWVIPAFLLLSNLAVAADSTPAETVADRMLDALGGRQAWAELRNTINGSQQNRTGEPTVVYAVITMDFENPRFRIDTTARDLHLARVIDGEKSWRLRRSGQVESVPPDLFDEEMAWYAAHLYRTIHRIADRDPALSLGVDEQERLTVFAGGERLMWFRLDARGEPFAFGTYGDESGTILGPWNVVQDGIHHPAWVSSADGTWRAAVKALTVNVPLQDHLFARPAPDNTPR